MIRFVISALCFIISIELTNCSRANTQQELHKFINSTINIPNIDVVQNGILMDSLQHALPPNIKLINYYTPAKGCVSCWISHLYDIDLYLEDKINEYFTPVVIILIDENNEDEVLSQLKRQPHCYPIYIDKNKQFERKNTTLPSDYKFHTFLVDRNNKVVLIGNPLNGDAMWNLFKSTLENMLAHDGEYVPEN